MKDHLFIIDSVKPYPGHIQSTAYPDDSGVMRVSCSGYLHNQGGVDLTIDEYRVLVMPNIRLLEWDELAPIVAEFERSLITDPATIDHAQFWEMLEVLPPCRWHDIAGWNVFHVSEHLTGSLVSWFARGHGSRMTAHDMQYREFTDSCFATDAHLQAKLDASL